jgi:tetratricopeptide (TPR) repeat protein
MTMRCQRAKEHVSELLDGTLGAPKEALLRRHLEECTDCRAFLRDLEAIKGEAERLEKLVPPETAWTNVLAGIRERRSAGRAAERSAQGLPAWVVSFLGLRPLQYAVAAALVVTVTVGLAYFQPWGVALSADKAAIDRQTLVKLDEAEQYYQQAVQALSEAVATQQGGFNSEVAQVFQENLAIVDASIESCRQAVRRDPRDLETQYALMASYSQKVQLMTEWVMAQRTSTEKETSENGSRVQ